MANGSPGVGASEVMVISSEARHAGARVSREGQPAWEAEVGVGYKGGVASKSQQEPQTAGKLSGFLSHCGKTHGTKFTANHFEVYGVQRH